MDFESVLGLLENGTVDTVAFLYRQTPDRIVRFANTVPLPVSFPVKVSLYQLIKLIKNQIIKLIWKYLVSF